MPDHQPQPDEPDYRCGDARADAEQRALNEYRPMADRIAILRAQLRALDRALGYKQPGAHLHPESVAGCYRCDLSADDFTGPDADVPALIASNHRGTGSDHHAISDVAPRYLDDGDEYPYD